MSRTIKKVKKPKNVIGTLGTGFVQTSCAAVLEVSVKFSNIIVGSAKARDN